MSESQDSIEERKDNDQNLGKDSVSYLSNIKVVAKNSRQFLDLKPNHPVKPQHPRLEKLFSDDVAVEEIRRHPSQINTADDMTLLVRPKGSHKVFKVHVRETNETGATPPGSTATPNLGLVRQRGRIHLESSRVSRMPPESPTMSLSELRLTLDLSDEECAQITVASRKFPLKVPRYYAHLAKEYPELKSIVIPSEQELITYTDDYDKDVHSDESRYQPVEGIVHRYPGKLLFFPTLKCFGHCRFCFRSEYRVQPLSANKINTALDYIRENKEIREVIVTGGDPLTLPEEALEDILQKIRRIRHVEIIRIGTRALAFRPQVITPSLVKVLQKHAPLFMVLSFIHPGEITPYCEGKLRMLGDAGIVMLQQGPLLKGINDNPETLKQLYEKLAINRVLAYYAIYGIYAPGIRHFIVDRKSAKKIFAGLENNTSGHCLPHLITLDQEENKSRSVL